MIRPARLVVVERPAVAQDGENGDLDIAVITSRQGFAALREE